MVFEENGSESDDLLNKLAEKKSLEKPSRAERLPRLEKPNRPTKPIPAERPIRPERSEELARPSRPEKPDNLGKSTGARPKSAQAGLGNPPAQTEKPSPARIPKEKWAPMPAKRTSIDESGSTAKTTPTAKATPATKATPAAKPVPATKAGQTGKAIPSTKPTQVVKTKGVSGAKPTKASQIGKPGRLEKGGRLGKIISFAKPIPLKKRKKYRFRLQKALKVGDRCILRISALGPNGIGIDEYSCPYSIFVPNSNLGDRVKVKILKINLKETKYAIARRIKTLKKGLGISSLPVKPNERLTVKIKKVTSKKIGLVSLEKGYKLIVPNAKKGAEVNVVITRLKPRYAFANILVGGLAQKGYSVRPGRLKAKDESRSLKSRSKLVPSSLKLNGLTENSKYTLVLPKRGVYLRKYVIVKLQGSLVFVRFGLGAKPGSRVRIKITKVNEKFAMAKIIQINPVSLFKKRILVQHNIREMINNSMHLGEKVIKCNARMKNYLWLKKQTLRSEPKNRPLIKQKRHIINLLKTRRCLNKALVQLSKYALKGRTFLFIGTKKAAAGLIARASLFSKTSFFVNTRWLGGMLTNWKTIIKSISKIRPILKEKQRIVADILQIRESIKRRLIKKALLLKKRSRLLIAKSRFLMKQYKRKKIRKLVLKKTTKLSEKRSELLDNCYLLLSKRKALLTKRKDIMYEGLLLKQKGLEVGHRYQRLLNQFLGCSRKLRELKALLLLSTEIKTMKAGKDIVNISYAKVRELTQDPSNADPAILANLVPNPPKDILDLIVYIMKAAAAQNQKANESGKRETGKTKGTNSSHSKPRSTPNITNSSTNNSANNGNGASLNGNGSQSATPRSSFLIASNLLTNFSQFAPYLATLIAGYERNREELKKALKQTQVTLRTIQSAIVSYKNLKKGLGQELKGIRTRLVTELSVIRLVKTKLKKFLAQKKLLQFLPQLASLSTSSFRNKIREAVKVLMQTLVDPKLKYPMDNIYDYKLMNNPKKIVAARKKKWQRLEKYFGGIANMTKMSQSQISRNIAIVIGQREEMNAVRECKKLGIKMFNIIDTNCNPTLADHVIPANDDSRNSIKYILNKFLVRIRLAQKLRKKYTKSKKRVKKNKRVLNSKYQAPKPFKKTKPLRR